MHVLIRRKLALVAIAAAALVVPTLLPVASAQAASSPAAVAAAKAQWQTAIARVPARDGAGCYQASYPSLSWHAVACVTAPADPVGAGALPRSRRAHWTGDGR